MTFCSSEISATKEANSLLFLTEKNIQFLELLNSLDDSTKHIITHNKQLNKLYDIFLDFILDSSRILEGKQ